MEVRMDAELDPQHNNNNEFDGMNDLIMNNNDNVIDVDADVARNPNNNNEHDVFRQQQQGVEHGDNINNDNNNNNNNEIVIDDDFDDFDDEEEDDDDDDDDDDLELPANIVIDAGPADNVKPPKDGDSYALVLQFELSESLPEHMVPSNHPIYRPGVVVSVGLDKSTELKDVFSRYCTFASKFPPDPKIPLSISTAVIDPSELEFYHCTILNPTDNAENAALMKNDKIFARLNRSQQRHDEMQLKQKQKESDNNFCTQMRLLLPDLNPSPLKCDVLFKCTGKIIDENGYKQEVLTTLVRGHSAILRKRCKWLKEKIDSARDEKSYLVNESHNNNNNNNNHNNRNHEEHDPHRPLDMNEQQQQRQRGLLRGDIRYAIPIPSGETDGGEDERMSSSSHHLDKKYSNNTGSDSKKRKKPYDNGSDDDDDDDEEDEESILPVPREFSASDDEIGLAEVDAVDRHHAPIERDDLNHHHHPSIENVLPAEHHHHLHQLPHDDQENDRRHHANAVEFDEGEDGPAASPSKGHPIILNTSYDSVRSSSPIMSLSNGSTTQNAVIVHISHPPEAFKLLLEYCYTNHVLSLGREAYIEALKTKPDESSTIDLENPFLRDDKPLISLPVALAGIQLAEEAKMPRLSFMCEIAASQLVTSSTVLEALSLCEQQYHRTENRLPRLRKACLLYHILDRGSKGVLALSTMPSFRRLLKDRKEVVVPSLFTGLNELFGDQAFVKMYDSNVSKAAKSHMLRHNDKKDDYQDRMKHFIKKLDEDDIILRNQERLSRRMERWNKRRKSGDTNINPFGLTDECQGDPENDDLDSKTLPDGLKEDQSNLPRVFGAHVIASKNPYLNYRPARPHKGGSNRHKRRR